MSKGEATRQRILDRAGRLASRDGLEGLSLGVLAADLGLSKSGLFAHFGSKEDLQVAVLAAAAERFSHEVVARAMRAPRGEPRLRKLFDLWTAWVSDPARPGGCVFVAASIELDDRECRAREYLVSRQRQLRDALVLAVEAAVEAGHFRKDLDCEGFAFEMHAIVLGYNHARRLLREERAEALAEAAFERLLACART
jgi:AcrR family transcriptional regulator